jgi:two-component system, chemotaxis family, sensor histidine kinase and response regulator WspE
MRAAHSLKGAARIVGHEGVVTIAHELEECFVAAQEERIALGGGDVDVLLHAVDVMAAIAAADQESNAADSAREEIAAVMAALRTLVWAHAVPAAPPAERAPLARPVPAPLPPPSPATANPASHDDSQRLLTLAGEALVATRALTAHAERQNRELRADQELARALDAVVQRVSDAVGQLYEGVLDSRMRPFGEGVVGLPRMVRDTARTLGRDVDLVIAGDATPVDRELLRRLDALLGHLVRNAVDHGIEPRAERLAWGKEPRGTVRVEARHGGARLVVSVEDDGRGIDLAAVRERVVARGLADASAASAMSDAELSHFLFLPGFTMRDEVTPISGRGVGLDAVLSGVREIGGDVRVILPPTGGTRFELQLPLTLSVISALVVTVGGEPYAIPLARVHRVLRVERSEIASVEGRQHFLLDGRQVGLLWAHQLLELDVPLLGEQAAVVVIGEREGALGIVVDEFVGEQELVLRGLDPRLGKVQDVGGAALLADGSPLLVLDVDDLMRTTSTLVAGGRLDPLRHASVARPAVRKRVLVVDDSLTVRELERKMIEGAGYAVDVAVDGMDAWNAIRAGRYDLVVTDVDMPRLDGIELVSLIKRDAELRHTPVMIVSYKDRDEDRRRGLDAGADYYLTKSSFYDETLLRAVDDFIGGDA